jgi:hypothetical protein
MEDPAEVSLILEAQVINPSRHLLLVRSKMALR